MQVTVLKPATLSVFLMALVAGSVHAHTPPSARPEARSSPLSEIAHDFSTWWSRVTGTGANHRRATSSPPLPRPRPAEVARAGVVQNQDPAEVARAHCAQKESSGAYSDKRLSKKTRSRSSIGDADGKQLCPACIAGLRCGRCAMVNGR